MIETLHIVVAMKPLGKQNFAESAVSNGVAGLNIDGCRVGVEMIEHHRKPQRAWRLREGRSDIPESADYRVTTNMGRWPANVIHDGSDGVVGGFPATKSGNLLPNHERHTDGGNGNTNGKMKGIIGITRDGDSGSAARFFKECLQDD